MDESDLTERLMSAAEFADVLRVGEADVLEWMLAGHIAFEDGEHGEPRVRVAEERETDGPISTGMVCYSISRDPAFQADLARRRRERELADLDWGGVRISALADALAIRLGKVVPAHVRVTADADRISILDAQGHGCVIDVAFHAGVSEAVSDTARVRSASVAALERCQDELAEATTDPWPARGRTAFPTPRTVLTPDGTGLRLLYGDPADPVLELEPLPVAEVIVMAGRRSTTGGPR